MSTLTARTFLGRWLALSCVICFVVASARGQLAGCSLPLTPGQWLAPVDFDPLMTGLAEIAHAVVLPPPVDDAETPLIERVAFWCRRLENPCSAGAPTLFIWQPRLLTELDPVPVTPAPADGSGEIFCSGHTALGDGSVLIAGGLDMERHCDGSLCEYLKAVGHKHVYRLDTSLQTLAWISIGNLLDRERYYPIVLTRNDGGALVAGHVGEPGGVCYPIPPGTKKNDEVRERFSLTTGLVLPPEDNLEYVPGNCTPSAAKAVPLWDYPRMHLLRTGNVVHTNGFVMSPSDHLWWRTIFMNLKQPDCLGTPPESRWRINPQGFVGSQEITGRHGGSSIHLIVRNALDQATEVIYILGGQDGTDDEGCSDASTDTVWKMVGPAASGASWVAAAPLNVSRANHNTVVLADGSFAVIGGTHVDPLAQPPCDVDICKAPEFYKPPEIFGDEDAMWELGPEQLGARRYHSVAGLLMDGRAFSAGGYAPGDDWHTLEVFQPWYCYAATRPRIMDWPRPDYGETIGYRGPTEPNIIVDMTLPGNVGITRFALLRPASVTHAFDSGQRYVELFIVSHTGNPSSGAAQYQLSPPQDSFEAPPGFYYLVGVDVCGLPSVGRWVQVSD